MSDDEHDIKPTLIVYRVPSRFTDAPSYTIYQRHEGIWTNHASGKKANGPLSEKLDSCWSLQWYFIDRHRRLDTLRSLIDVASVLPNASIETLTCVARSFLAGEDSPTDAPGQTPPASHVARSVLAEEDSPCP